MAKKEKKKGSWQQFISLGFMLLIGVVCGIVMAQFLIAADTAGESIVYSLPDMLLLFASMYVGLFVHFAVHEAGHLVFGLMSGYGFSSYRIGSFMLLKENGKLRLRRFSLAGTGGQCLMTPPDMVDGKIPYVLYNLGGSICNLLLGGVCLAAWFFCPTGVLRAMLLMMAAIGFGVGLMNGIPMRMGAVDNDGYNALSLSKDPAALRSFWIQMKANELIAQGTRLKDMPEEWFAVPDEAGMKNSMTATLGVFACNRLMDAQQIPEAVRLMDRLLAMDSAIVGLHRNLMLCDRVFCELLGEGKREILDQLQTKEQKAFMKSMKNCLTVLRTEYAWALLGKKDEPAAVKILTAFEKAAKTYPYPSDVQSERELISLAERKKAETDS